MAKRIIDITIPTTEMHKDPAGVHPFSPERMARQDKVIGELFKKKILPEVVTGEERDNPVLLVVGGPPGCGKSTINKWARDNHVLGENFVSLTLNTFSAMPEFGDISQQTRHPHPEKHPSFVDEYYYLRRKALDECIKRCGYSLIIDDHCDNIEKDKELLDTAKAAGYTTMLVGMTITPAGYFALLRSLKESQEVKDKYTPWALGLFQHFAGNFEDIARNFDYTFLYQKMPNPINPLSLICELYTEDGVTEGGKKKLDGGIIDGGRYERFKRWATVNAEAITLEGAFPRGQDEELEDYKRRVGAVGNGNTERREGDPTGKTGNGVRLANFVDRIKHASHKAINLFD